MEPRIWAAMVMRALAIGVLLATAPCALALAQTPKPVESNPCNQGTTYDIRMCWDKQNAAAVAEMKTTYAKVAAAYSKLGVDTASLAASQAAWLDTRDKTCEFEYALYLPGTIAPQIGVECAVRMTRARTLHLTDLLAKVARPPEKPVSAPADAELNRVYNLYVKRLTAEQRASLSDAEHAWIAYRDKACTVQGGSCLTELTNERTAELKASWIGEVFW